MTKDARHHELITALQAIQKELKHLREAIAEISRTAKATDEALSNFHKASPQLAKYLPPENKPWYWATSDQTYPAPSDDSED